MKALFTRRIVIFAAALIVLAVASFAANGDQTARADSTPSVEFGCLIFGVDAEDCPDGALIVHDTCAVFSTAIEGSPTSKLDTYADYLDLGAIYTSGPDFDEDGLGELITGINAPGDITMIVTPGGKLNIQCEIDVSEYVLPDAPNGALVTPFHCGPAFDPLTSGSSRLTSKGMLRINCHVGGFGDSPGHSGK
jgi:hypothetical protein